MSSDGLIVMLKTYLKEQKKNEAIDLERFFVSLQVILLSFLLACTSVERFPGSHLQEVVQQRGKGRLWSRESPNLSMGL